MTRRRPLRRGLLALALLLLAWAGPRLLWRVQLERELAALEREGLSIRAEAFPLRTNGPEERAAVQALVDAAKDVDAATGAGNWLPGTLPEGLQRALAAPYDPETIAVVFQPDPDPAGAQDLASAAALLLTALDRGEPAIDAALARRVRLEIEPSTRSVPFERAQATRELSNGLWFRASWRALHGDPDGAWADAERALGMIELYDEPLLLPWLIRVALGSHAARGIEALLLVGPPPREDRRARIDAALARLLERERDLVPGLRDDLRRQLDLTTREEMEARLSFDLDPGEWSGRRFLNRIQAAWFLPLWKRDLAIHQAAAIRLLVRATGTPGGGLAELRALEEAPRGRLVLEGFVSSARAKGLESVALLRMARTALDLARRGELPEPLALDPFDPSGASLRWRRPGPGEGLLWSVGADQKDDGGVDPEELYYPEPGTDLLWRLAPPPR